MPTRQDQAFAVRQFAKSATRSDCFGVSPFRLIAASTAAFGAGLAAFCFGSSPEMLPLGRGVFVASLVFGALSFAPAVPTVSASGEGTAHFAETLRSFSTFRLGVLNALVFGSVGCGLGVFNSPFATQVLTAAGLFATTAVLFAFEGFIAFPFAFAGGARPLTTSVTDSGMEAANTAS